MTKTESTRLPSNINSPKWEIALKCSYSHAVVLISNIYKNIVWGNRVVARESVSFSKDQIRPRTWKTYSDQKIVIQKTWFTSADTFEWKRLVKPVRTSSTTEMINSRRIAVSKREDFQWKWVERLSCQFFATCLTRYLFFPLPFRFFAYPETHFRKLVNRRLGQLSSEWRGIANWCSTK